MQDLPNGDRTSRVVAAFYAKARGINHRRLVSPAVALVICILLLLALQKISQSIDYHSVSRQLFHMPAGKWAAALAATALSFVALVARDEIGLRHVDAKVPRSLLWIGATAASALGNIAGFGALTGGAVRCRVYGAAGVTSSQVGRLTLLTSGSLVLATLLISALGALLDTGPLSAMTHLAPRALTVVSVIVLALLALAVVCCGAKTKRIPTRWSGITLDIPSRASLVSQIIFGVVDVVGAGAALWVFLPGMHAAGFVSFIAVYSASLLLGIVGHTPGGVGVFESVMVFALRGDIATPALLAALLAYRAVYFGLPLVLSAAVLIGYEARALRKHLPLRSMGRIAPLFLCLITFVVGSMLVMSSATPALAHRLAVLRELVPLWALEGSQLVSGVFGVLLLFVSRGLLRRLDAAWWLSVVLTAVSLVLSVIKGLAFVEAGVLATLLLLLLCTHGSFNRRAALFAEPFTPGWLISVAIVLICSAWVMFFAYRNIPYRADLWWDFEFHARASRSLRAMLASSLFAAAFAVWQLLRPAAGRFVHPSAEDLTDAIRIIRSQERSDAGLAMMGDKSFLFSDSREAFLMFAKHGRTWAALHDPVGPREEWAELIRKFVMLAHKHGGRAAFYQVRADSLPLYLDSGLTLMKLGEEARLALDQFDLNGPKRAALRYSMRRAERDGCTVEVIDAAAMPEHIEILRRISDSWLDSRSAREKSFSVAAFSDAYLAAQSVMLVRQNGEPVAFTTYMTTDLNVEATVGVMRHVADASPFVMDYLFVQLAMHLKREGYRHLSLGVAPFSGVRPMPLGSPLHQLGSLVWRFGGRFYNFQGLRAFKGKFQPRWEPRYLAVSGWAGAVLTLLDLSILAGGRRS
ncbi:bifunctional lysylphosphatidylglycerol flippase/synthetase MprF [Trinickia diaoshuihuensis]|uniref:bifunctional lysylphosphatidylglycerol flippase/synthetase MprF n=1 Tax=Trinickia diaoshuihuensis TaxID=2292265 RepID=UPI000E276D53|nr:bifunctional lysylphosphatidylglycerol flippase/synthetase MprF [Trinickia diaoshuihuensis]